MLHLLDSTKFKHSRVALVFRTVVVDRAGETPWCRPVAAEVVEADVAGTAILLTPNRVHLLFPVWALQEPTADITEALTTCKSISAALKAFNADRFAYVGGQEVVWDIHNAVTPAAVRYLMVDEIAEALADLDSLVDADAEPL